MVGAGDGNGGMARNETDKGVTQSILDRLMDLEPREPADPQFSRSTTVRQYKTSVRRDLQNLLNTRRIRDQAGDDLPLTKKSLFNIGLPDFTSLTLASPADRKKLTSEIAETIEYFEPRLQSVRVQLVESTGINTRALNFHIEALLIMDPAPEQITFDAVFEPSRAEYEVRGGDR